MWIVIVVLYRSFRLLYSYQRFFFQVCILPELLGDDVVKGVTVRNCCMYGVCFFDGSVKYDYVRSSVVGSSISYYGPVVIIIIIIIIAAAMCVFRIVFHSCVFVLLIHDVNTQLLNGIKSLFFAVYVPV